MEPAAISNPSTLDSALRSVPRLTAAEVAAFELEGYIRYERPVLPEARFRALVEHFEGTLKRLSPGVQPEDMDVPHFADPGLFEWLFDPAILDLVEPLIGPDIALYSSHFICKPAGTGRRVPWHKDSDYWHGRLDPQDVVTVWLAIDPSTVKNGALKVIPRTHHTLALSEYDPVDPKVNVFSNEIKKSTLDVDRAVTIELEPNQASLHHARLVHGSDKNDSALRRTGYTMRYMSTRTRLVDSSRNDCHRIFLARGKDHAGNRYAEPGKDYSGLLSERRGPRGH